MCCNSCWPKYVSTAFLLLVALAGVVHAKRTPPPKVPPVVISETEYGVAHEKSSEAGKPGGLKAFVVAHDAKSAKELWRVELYTIHYKGDLETDVQDVFLNSLKADGAQLIATDEKGHTYHIDPATKTVTPGK